jgi:RNA polymerase subunit RPABC4/transcription elongation factor Spt4
MESIMLVKPHALNESQKSCTRCGRILPDVYQPDICPACEEMILFNKVKAFIRENDVKEADVAREFHLPLSKVRGWIREGRIEYKGIGGEKIGGVFCHSCGKPIDFGTECPECHRANALKTVTQLYHHDDNEQMRFHHNQEGGFQCFTQKKDAK